MSAPGYGRIRQLPGVEFEFAKARVTAALATDHVGVLSEFDIKEAPKKKIDVDMPPHTIPGACNPRLAHESAPQGPRERRAGRGAHDDDHPPPCPR